MTERFQDWAISRGAELGGEKILHFGDPRTEYHAARSEVALFDRSDRGRLRISGAQALDLLHRTTTQDLRSLAAGRGALSVIQTETARILDWVVLWAREEDLVMITGHGRARADLEWIDRMVIMDDVAVEDLTARTALFEIVGPKSPGVAAVLGGAGAAEMNPGDHRAFEWREIRGLLARGRAAPSPSFWILVRESDDVRVADILREAGLAAPAGDLAAESIRIETGQPMAGRELTEATNPLEADLLDSISFNKGCYTGQEVITRLVTHSPVKRTLAGFVLEQAVTGPEFDRDFPVIPADGDEGGPGQRAVGRLTSAAFCFGLGHYGGLGIVNREFSRPGTRVFIQAGERTAAARVVDLPMPVGAD